jgi:hypothetical protein
VTCGFDCSLSHVQFARVANDITGDKPDDFVQMKWFQKMAEVPNEESLPRQIESQMVDLVSELRGASLQSYVDMFSTDIPDGLLPQVCHLAALAWKGNLERLIDYHEIFQRGHRLRFVPMITADMIDRALDIAAARAP